MVTHDHTKYELGTASEWLLSNDWIYPFEPNAPCPIKGLEIPVQQRTHVENKSMTKSCRFKCPSSCQSPKHVKSGMLVSEIQRVHYRCSPLKHCSKQTFCQLRTCNFKCFRCPHNSCIVILVEENPLDHMYFHVPSVLVGQKKNKKKSVKRVDLEGWEKHTVFSFYLNKSTVIVSRLPIQNSNSSVCQLIYIYIQKMLLKAVSNHISLDCEGYWMGFYKMADIAWSGRVRG